MKRGHLLPALPFQVQTAAACGQAGELVRLPAEGTAGGRKGLVYVGISALWCGKDGEHLSARASWPEIMTGQVCMEKQAVGDPMPGAFQAGVELPRPASCQVTAAVKHSLLHTSHPR